MLNIPIPAQQMQASFSMCSMVNSDACAKKPGVYAYFFFFKEIRNCLPAWFGTLVSSGALVVFIVFPIALFIFVNALQN